MKGGAEWKSNVILGVNQQSNTVIFNQISFNSEACKPLSLLSNVDYLG